MIAAISTATSRVARRNWALSHRLAGSEIVHSDRLRKGNLYRNERRYLCCPVGIHIRGISPRLQTLPSSSSSSTPASSSPTFSPVVSLAPDSSRMIKGVRDLSVPGRASVMYHRPQKRDSAKKTNQPDADAAAARAAQSGIDQSAEAEEPAEEMTLARRIRTWMHRNRGRILAIFLGATSISTSVRLWGERLRYEHDIGARDERIQMLSEELQGRFDLEYDSLESIRREKEVILKIVDEFAASWPSTKPVNPKTAQKNIADLKLQMQDWFREQELKLTPKEDDVFVQASDTGDRNVGPKFI